MGTMARLAYTAITVILCIIVGFIENWWRTADKLKDVGSILGSRAICAWFMILCVISMFVVWKSHRVDSLVAWYITCATALIRSFLLILWVNAFASGEIQQVWYPYAICVISFMNIFVELAALYNIVYSDEVIAIHGQENATTTIWLSLPAPHAFWNDHQEQMEAAEI